MTRCFILTKHMPIFYTDQWCQLFSTTLICLGNGSILPARSITVYCLDHWLVLKLYKSMASTEHTCLIEIIKQHRNCHCDCFFVSILILVQVLYGQKTHYNNGVNLYEYARRSSENSFYLTGVRTYRVWVGVMVSICMGRKLYFTT